ncbi:hypothetical protein METESE_31450 [Mesoterricola sediminis]|uniref:Cell wall polymerase n=1 Tax=Mesoterricola sediminis TaxID=2927980 RepID=A0AA48KFC8_9BACT|nr:hypothetical protein METESE_31450 [Mesoterricola sediminis]
MPVDRTLPPWTPLAPIACLAFGGLIGALVMALAGAAPARVATQLVALGAALGLAWVLRSVPAEAVAKARFWLPALALLGAAFLDVGLIGIHRWVSLGPIHLHTGFLACPLLLVALARGLAEGRWRAALLLAGATQALLCLQPDAGTATAFALGAAAAAAATPALARPARTGLALALLALAVPAWTRPDHLSPVPVVEGILALAATTAGVLGVLARLAALALPASLAILALDTRRRDPGAAPVAAGLAAFAAGAFLAPALGQFPVPVLGYGISPLLGLAFASGLLGGAARRAA